MIDSNMNTFLYSNLDKMLLELIKSNPFMGVSHGKMGICIYFFLMGHYENNQSKRETGEDLLNQVIDLLDQNQELDIENGLAGIALGIRFLIKKGIVQGDVNEVLEDIDNTIFRRLNDERNSIRSILNDSQIIQMLYYIYIRLGDFEESTDNYILFKDLLIKIVNVLGDESSTSYMKESSSFSLYSYQLPLLLDVLGRILKLKIYNDKISHIITFLTPQILSHRPYLHAFRLFLLYGLQSFNGCTNTEKGKLSLYMHDLEKQIDIDRILDVELKNQDIFISNGVAGIYLLIKMLEIQKKNSNIQLDIERLKNRILKSEAWHSLLHKPYFFKIHHGLFNGFPGTAIILWLMSQTKTM